MANKPFAIQGADLTLGGVKITLNDNGSVTFPDGSVQTTAYKGGNLNTWVQTFETSLRIADIPSVATSVEYLANGDIVALFVNLKDINLGFASYNTYTGVARFDTIGRLSKATTSLKTSLMAGVLLWTISTGISMLQGVSLPSLVAILPR
jgi:hypothetical protein